MNVFESSHYKDYLASQIKLNENVRGYKSLMAGAAGCHKAYLSQVINSHVHLTPEHGAGLCHFWGLIQLEREYFMELLNYERAGTPALREILGAKLATLRSIHENLGERFKKPKISPTEDQAIYYSAWYYSAIHILLTVPGFQTSDKISQHLKLSRKTVQESLLTLQRMGLASKKGDLWKPLSFDIHLPKESPLTTANHVAWRAKGLQDIYLKREGTIHYTAVHSLSHSDYQSIKDLLFELISKVRQTAKDSKEETLISFTCDLFDF